MASGKSKNHVGKVGLGEVGETTETGRGGTQGVGKFLQDGGTSGTTVWI